MADLADIDHFYGEDIGVTPSGDIAIVTKDQRTTQRIIRRLLTPPTGKTSSYPWLPTFGVGLGEKIGEALDPRAIEAKVRSQMLAEPSVAKSPAPKISVTPIPPGATIDVTYSDTSGQPKTFGFDLAP